MKKKKKKVNKVSLVTFYIIWILGAALLLNCINHQVFRQRIKETYIISDKSEEKTYVSNYWLETYKLTVRSPDSKKDLYNVPVKKVVYDNIDVGDSAVFGITNKGLERKLSSIIFLMKK